MPAQPCQVPTAHTLWTDSALRQHHRGGADHSMSALQVLQTAQSRPPTPCAAPGPRPSLRRTRLSLYKEKVSARNQLVFPPPHLHPASPALTHPVSELLFARLFPPICRCGVSKVIAKWLSRFFFCCPANCLYSSSG